MFIFSYDSEDIDCNSFVGLWETVAHKLRGLVNVGKLDTAVNDDVSERFRIDDNQCPVFLLWVFKTMLFLRIFMTLYKVLKILV